MGSNVNTNTTASSSTSTPTTSGSPCGKRTRDPEDEVYLDNFHSHKRYLSEIMASSLNGLTVGDPLPENLMDSPARSESMFYMRDELSLQYSPMSEDYDESRYVETSTNACSSQSDSLPTSPVSPYRWQKPSGGFSSSNFTASSPSHSSALTASCSQPRQRGSDSEGRFPSSPSDICHSADLRRAALLRSVQMRTQPSVHSAYELPFGPEPESASHIIPEDMKSLADEREYHIEECPTIGMTSSESNQEKSFDAMCAPKKSGDESDS